VFNSSIFAQDNASESVPVTVSLVTGLTIAHTSGNLDFTPVVVTTALQTIKETPQNGAEFTVTGHPDRSINVSFDDPTPLSNGATGNLVFDPNVEYTDDISYSGAIGISSGGTCTLVGGDVYLWVGGDIDIPANQESGDYSGSLTVTVAY